MTQIHILNGDDLKSIFPKNISGEIIVTRECLIDGDVQGDTLAELFANRASFIERYPEVPSGAYIKSSVPEFDKTLAIASNNEVYCWFEHDLFCQVNFWFVLFFLAKNDNNQTVRLVLLA